MPGAAGMADLKESWCYLIRCECLSFVAVVIVMIGKGIEMGGMEGCDEQADRPSGHELYRVSVEEINRMVNDGKLYPPVDAFLCLVEFSLSFPLLFILATVGAVQWVRDMVRDGRTDDDTIGEILSAIGFFGFVLVVGAVAIGDYSSLLVSVAVFGFLALHLVFL
jgi:hypothetical protein